MKGRKLLYAIALCAAFLTTACGTARTADEQPHTLIVWYDSTVGPEALLKAIKAHGSQVIYQYKNFNSMAIRIPKKESLQKAIQHYQKVKGVLSVNEDQINHLD